MTNEKIIAEIENYRFKSSKVDHNWIPDLNNYLATGLNVQQAALVYNLGFAHTEITAAKAINIGTTDYDATDPAQQLALARVKAKTQNLYQNTSAWVTSLSSHEKATLDETDLDSPEAVICTNLLLSTLRTAKGGALDSTTRGNWTDERETVTGIESTTFTIEQQSIIHEFKAAVDGTPRKKSYNVINARYGNSLDKICNKYLSNNYYATNLEELITYFGGALDSERTAHDKEKDEHKKTQKQRDDAIKDLAQEKVDHTETKRNLGKEREKSTQLDRDLKEEQTKNTQLTENLTNVNQQLSRLQGELKSEKDKVKEFTEKEQKITNLRNKLVRELRNYINTVRRINRSEATQHLKDEWDYENLIKRISLEDLENKDSENVFKVVVGLFCLKMEYGATLPSIGMNSMVETFITNVNYAKEMAERSLELIGNNKTSPPYIIKKLKAEGEAAFAKAQEVIDSLETRTQQVQPLPKS